jgi:hypothetical protein
VLLAVFANLVAFQEHNAVHFTESARLRLWGRLSHTPFAPHRTQPASDPLNHLTPKTHQISFKLRNSG